MVWPFSNSQRDSSSSQQCPASSSNSSIEKLDLVQNLPNDRVISSIPRYRSDSKETSKEAGSLASGCPIERADQKIKSQDQSTETDQNWVYPSPAQFYRALLRKDRPAEAKDMYTVVPIHNAVNERVWREVLEWEASYGRGAFDRWPRSGKSGPMLCSFRGRPNDLSPRAWMKILSGYQAPFDRHDWEIVRPTEERMRYVIDFYPGRGADEIQTSNSTQKPGPQSSKLPNLSFYIDVRPALDNWEGIRMRMLRSWYDIQSSFSSQSNPTKSS
ncbi:holocytochrome-c synthase [Phakopsora pachyrhizi]|uniref:Holocytochrome c-type synthase n=1 Tax=Phakopsora pachyrhizi TaxID=170000 RepID=A0AAV0BAH8_PHAPC|nr:holocytochrome-c synthase [Phakopsora pachyrhizi]CAH7683575.1 holocytochrome-c synthase [Phakopsora pachyrhizi]